MPHIIAITNQKGGVGKTTTSVNLAAALVAQQKKVLVVDLDPQGHASEHLGQPKEPVNSTVLEILLDKLPPEQVIKHTSSHLDLLNSNLQLGQFNQRTPQGNQFTLKNALDQNTFLQKYDYIIVDCQPALSLLTLNALTIATFVLLPVQAEYFALDGLSQLIVTLQDVRYQLNPKLTVLGILVTMYDARNRLSKEVWSELQQNFQTELFQTVIPRNVKLAEAPSFGQSVLEYEPSSNGAKAHQQLAAELLQKLDLKNIF